MRGCAAPDCDNVVIRRPGSVGRPAIYCSPACRPSRARPGVVVEIDQADDDHDAEAGRDWVVRLRRGRRTVVVQRGLGRFTATALATDLGELLGRPGTGAA